MADDSKPARTLPGSTGTNSSRKAGGPIAAKGLRKAKRADAPVAWPNGLPRAVVEAPAAPTRTTRPAATATAPTLPSFDRSGAANPNPTDR